MSHITPAPIPNDAVAELCHLSRQMLATQRELPELRQAVAGLVGKLDELIDVIRQQSVVLVGLDSAMDALTDHTSSMADRACEVRDALRAAK